MYDIKLNIKWFSVPCYRVYCSSDESTECVQVHGCAAHG